MISLNRKLQQNCVLLVMVLTTIALFSSLSFAMMQQTSISDLSGKADAIIVGTVVDQASNLSADGNMIYTCVTIQTDRVVKKSQSKELKPGGQITIRVEGGVVGDKAMRVSDMPSFENGKSVFLFLQGDKSKRVKDKDLGDFTVYGLELGSFPVAGGEVTITDTKEGLKGTINLDIFIRDIEAILSGMPVAASAYLNPANIH